MFNFIPSTIPHNIIVVGCGGTGSRLVPLLAQFIRSITKDYSPRGWLGTPNIVLCDPDTIEEKNLARQNFIHQDIGKNKAVVLAERYSKAYGVPIIPMTSRIEGHMDIQTFFTTQLGVNLGSEPCMIIMCVDSVVARRNIISNAMSIVYLNDNYSNVFIIDSGNEDNFGQVNFFNPEIGLHPDNFEVGVIEKLPKMITHVENIHSIPMDIKHYLELADNPGLGSCADLDQTLAINALVATNIIAVVQNYYYRKPMNFNKVFVDMLGGSSTTFNTMSYFLSIAAESYTAIKSHPNLKELSCMNVHLGNNHDIIYRMVKGIIHKEETARIKEEEAAKRAAIMAAVRTKAKARGNTHQVDNELKGGDNEAGGIVEDQVVEVKSKSRKSSMEDIQVSNSPPLQTIITTAEVTLGDIVIPGGRLQGNNSVVVNTGLSPEEEPF